MSGVHRVEHADGSVEYTDVPKSDAAAETPLAETLIKAAQKRVPKLIDCLEYLDYLRHHSPMRFDRVMNELRREDPLAWTQLQKYPRFRPLRETAVGLKAGTNLLEAGINLATGKPGGSAERWLESTVQAMMRRDAWGPYAEVLGARASTLPPKAAVYSGSRLGQYLQAEDGKLAAAAKTAARELEAARNTLRTASAAAFVRGASPMIDLGMEALRAENALATTNFLMRRRIELASRRNPEFGNDGPAYEQARLLLNQGRYDELEKLLKPYE